MNMKVNKLIESKDMNSFMPFVEDSYPVDHEILEFYSDHFSPNSFNS